MPGLSAWGDSEFRRLNPPGRRTTGSEPVQGDRRDAYVTLDTSTCWEALRLLREQPQEWRLWHPIDPSRPDAALRELPSIGPRTVVWLNEAQFYLDAAGQAGERVAAALRELLRDPGRAPVLILATLSGLSSGTP
jgi:hypothetical protein